MNKKGISPLIATILLIGMVAMLSVLIINFYKDLIEEETDDIGRESSLANYCLEGVDLSFEDICANISYSLLNMKIKNRAAGNINGFVFQVIESNEDYVSSSNVSLGNFSSRKYSFDFSGVSSEVDRILVIPLVEIGGLSGECSVKELEITSILNC